jgi:hypothetical protein
MKTKILPLILLVVSMGSYTVSHAQKSYVLTADSLTTGNYKDVFKSFFQLAFDRFTGNNKDLQFTSNPFAIMARADTTLLVDTNYVRYKGLRRLNFTFAAKLDSSYKFNGFSSGITYAIINRRDETVSKYFLAQAYQANDEFNKLLPALTGFVTGIADTARQNKINAQINSFFSENTMKFSDLDPELQAVIKNNAKALGAKYLAELISKDPKLNFAKLIRANYDSVRANFQNRLLWTAGIADTTYTDEFMFSNIVLSTNLVKGISKPLKPVGLEIDVRGAYQFLDDKQQTGRDLKRQTLIFEPGINLTVKTKRTQYPWLEFKLSGSYMYINRPYANERSDSTTVNGTLRVRVFGDVWIPLEIKYDPKSGNFLGFLNVRANFKALRNFTRKD